MSVVAILALAAAAAPLPSGVRASAQATAEILKPVVVRQESGPVAMRDMPRYQVTHRDGVTLIEFQ